MAAPFEADFDRSLSWFTGEFRDSEVEKRFHHEQMSEVVWQSQFMLALAAAFNAVLLAVNLVLPVGDMAALDVIPARSVAILASLGGFFLLGQLKDRHVLPLILTVSAILAASAASLIATQSHLAIFSVLLLPACFFILLPVGFLITLIAGLGTSFLMLAAYFSGGPATDMGLRVAVGALVLNALLIAIRHQSERKLRMIWANGQEHKHALAELAESRQLLERTFAAVPIPLIIVTTDEGAVTRANEAAETFLKVPPGKLVGQFTRTFFKDAGQRRKLARDVQRTGLVRSTPLDLVRSDGEARSALISASRMDDGSIIAGIMDVTDQQRQERQIRVAEREYRALFENAEVGIYRSRPDGTVVRANPALVRFNGYDTEAELIASVNSLSEEWYVQPGRREEWLRLMREHGRVTDFVSEVYRHKTRERVWISENSWTINNPDGTLSCFEGTLVEATDRKRLEEEIEHMALHDQLTNLANRRLLTERLNQACSWVQRHGGYFSVMCLDLDRFKAVNDAFGHSTGDLLLQEAARRLRQACRAEDTIARTGGDEFCVLSVGIGHPARMSLVAERIVEAFEKPFLLDGQLASVGISAGIAVAPTDGVEAKALLMNADKALYSAKDAGRNQYRFFNEDILAQARNATFRKEKTRA